MGHKDFIKFQLSITDSMHELACFKKFLAKKTRAKKQALLLVKNYIQELVRIARGNLKSTQKAFINTRNYQPFLNANIRLRHVLILQENLKRTINFKSVGIA